MTVKFAADLDSVLCWVKPTVLVLVTSTRCITVNNTTVRSAVVFCACEMIPLCQVVYRVIRAAHKFDFKVGKGKGHPCTGTEAQYRPYGP